MEDYEIAKELEDWAGIDVVQVKAKDLAKMHHALRTQRDMIKEMREKLVKYAGLSVCGVTSIKDRLEHQERLVREKDNRLRYLDQEVHSLKNNLAAKCKEIDLLKVRLYDKANS